MAGTKWELLVVGRNSRRAIAFLRGDDPFVNAWDFYQQLVQTKRRKIDRSFDYWINNRTNDTLHHGWTKSQHNGEFVDCHVFKVLKENERFYARKSHPLASDGRFELCLIVHALMKSQSDLPRSEARKVLEIASDGGVTRAVLVAFSEGSR